MYFSCLFLDITTDPVALWSSPSSATYQQLQFYNDHFMPFYRVEQVFVYTKDKTGSNYSSIGTGFRNYYGPVFNKSIMEEVIFEIAVFSSPGIDIMIVLKRRQECHL